MKKIKLLYWFIFLVSILCFYRVSAQTPTLSVTLDTNPLGGGPAPLTGLTMTATVGGTATGTINYYFYCDAPNDNSTDPSALGTPAYSGTTTSNTINMPAGRCDAAYANIGTYIAKVIVQRNGVSAEERRTVGVFNPVPAVDLKVRLEGATDWHDDTITVDYNTRAEIRWTFSGTSSCTMSGDWVGTKTAPGQEFTPNLTEARMYIYSLECNSPSGLLTDAAIVVVSPPTLFGNLTATPNTGPAPLIGSVLRANVTGGTAVGTINYTFYCNRSDAGTNITSNYNYKEDGVSVLNLPAPDNTCNAVYANPGSYTAKVIIERGGIAIESRTNIIVSAPPAPAVNLTAASTNLAYNTSTTLNWTVTNATSCTGTGSPAWVSTSKTLPSGSWQTGNLTASTTYTMTCTGPGGTGTDSVAVTVAGPPPPPYVELWARYNNMDYKAVTVPHGTSIFLSWNTGDPEPVNCEGYSTPPGNWGDPPILGDPAEKNPAGGWDYTGNLVGSSDPLVINQYTFTITCYNSAGVSRSDSVLVNVYPDYEPPIVDLEVRPTDGEYDTSGVNIDYGTSAELMWTVENAVSGTTCQASGDWTGPRPVTGTESTGRRTILSEYTLTCTSPGGIDADTVRVTVNPPPQATVNLRVSQSGSGNYSSTANIPCNEGVDLQWEVTNAISCVGEGDWGGLKSTDGGNDTFTYLTEDAFYGLRCENAAGESVWSGVNVYVVRDCPTNTPIIFQNPLGQSDFREILDSLSGLIRMIAIGLAAIMIIISGIIIITSIDDRERLNKGKNMLKWALIGLAISLASSFIIGFIEEIVG